MNRSILTVEDMATLLNIWDAVHMLRKYALLDDYGKRAVDSVLRTEFNRAQEQGTLNSCMSISVSVRSKPIKDHT